MTKKEQYMQELEAMRERLREMADSHELVCCDGEDMEDRLKDLSDDIKWIIRYLNI